jgi:transcriptional regulator GlxA family with amidase domain
MSGQLLKVTDWKIVAQTAKFKPASMAAMCSISLRQLERHFANQFHQTPGAWTRELRLRLAKELILQGWSNKAVAAELDFTDNPHLCREFKRKCGTTPRRYAPLHLRGSHR